MRFGGREWPSETEQLDLVNVEIDDLEPLRALPRLRILRVGVTNPHISLRHRLRDFGPLADLRELAVLEFPHTHVNDLSALAGLEQLVRLDVSDSQVSDLSPLSRLHRLRLLRVGSTEVRDLSPLGALAELEHLDVGDTPVAEITPVAALERLTSLNVWGANVDPDAVEELQRRRPGLKIT